MRETLPVNVTFISEVCVNCVHWEMCVNETVGMSTWNDKELYGRKKCRGELKRMVTREENFAAKFFAQLQSKFIPMPIVFGLRMEGYNGVSKIQKYRYFVGIL